MPPPVEQYLYPVKMLMIYIPINKHKVLKQLMLSPQVVVEFSLLRRAKLHDPTPQLDQLHKLQRHLK